MLAICFTLSACKPKPQTYSSDVVVGGAESKGPLTTADEMLLRQEKEKERQEKELQDIRRQEHYDQQYRRYIKEH